MTRDERQSICIEKWKAAGCKGTMLLATGFGKTITALKICKRLVALKSNATIIVAVPSDNLKKQWVLEVAKFGLHEHVMVNTVHSLVKQQGLTCDLFIADEIHMYASDIFINVFDTIQYKLLLGLTGTIKRLDGKEERILRYAPVVDEIKIEEAIQNKWVSEYVQYKVELEVNLEEYERHNSLFLHHFAYFGHNFDLAMGCLSKPGVRALFARQIKEDPQAVFVKALGFSRALRARKDFIYNHLDKIEVANQIIEARPNSKIITFTKNVNHAKLILRGDLFHGGIKPASKKDAILTKFNTEIIGTLNTCKAVDFGTDIKGVNVAIILSGDSASITKNQRIGRALRYADGKVAELWNLVIKGTAEEQWFNKANDGKPYIVVRQDQLGPLLKGEDWQSIPEPKPEFLFVL